uniref:FMRFamide-like neuropeptide GGKYMRF-amide n=1 Tax=Hirudo medicinalis TaxID=6421 RepID=FAR5_HIRME|nr:RecName: Full=FMRFamide-like neuropeptide GGKYMRF-amide [Hirudo medicinalis]
GGKYMRF